MRSSLVFLLVGVLCLAVGAQTASAAPADVSVRIEGVNQTLFDRVVRSDGHEIQASSDSTVRHCDGTNLGANPEPGPTPTAASVDAMQIIGQTFDGDWYDGYDDYFITRWGTEVEDNAKGWWWGILVNGEFTPVGGCQYRVVDGDEVLWINEAFNGRPMLELQGPATATTGQPVTVTVSTDLAEAYEGATVGGINAAAAPYPNEIVVPGTTAANGTVSVTFNEPGWKRLKARDPGASGEIDDAVASNSIDVCVERKPGDGCTGEAPSRIPAQVGQAPAVEIPEPVPTCDTDPSLCRPPTCETQPSLCPPTPSPGLEIGSVTKPRRLPVGGEGNLGVKIFNPGAAATASIRLCPKTWSRLASAGCVRVGTLAAGESRIVRFTLRARRGIRPGSATVRVTASGESVPSKVKSLKIRTTRGKR